MIYGYARVSTSGQNLEAQLEQLKEYGVEKIYKEKVSGRNTDNRIQFKKLLDVVGVNDVIVVTKLDRFARSTKDALTIIDMLNEKEVGLVVLNVGGDKLDTSTPMGKLMITMLSGIAEFELALNRERTLEGVANAKAKGLYKGKPKKYTDKHKGLQHALELFNDRENNKLTVNDIAEKTNISRATIYRAIKEQEQKHI